MMHNHVQFGDRCRGVLAVLLLVLGFLPTLALPASAGDFGKGINLNTWFTWPRYAGWDKPGVLKPAYVPVRHEDGRAALAHIKSLGFKTVRIGVDPAPFIALSGDERAEAKALVMAGARTAIEAGLDVIFDLHPNSRHKVYGQFALIRGGDDPMFLQFLEAIQDFAGELTKLPAGRVALELMNEPRLKCVGEEQERWLGLLDAMIGAARGKASRLPLIVSGSCISAIEGLIALDPSRWKDPNLYYTFHFYEPFIFSHQSAAFMGWPEKHLQNLPWPPKSVEDARPWLDAAETRLAKLPEADRDKTRDAVAKVFARYMNSGADKSLFSRRFTQVSQWADKHKVPRNHILLGEFGVWSTTGELAGAKCEDRATWLREVREALDQHGFIWTFFHYDGPFGIVQGKGPARVIDTAPLKALGISREGKCPV